MLKAGKYSQRVKDRQQYREVIDDTDLM